MSPGELLSHLQSLDVRLWAEGERLRYSAPQGTLDPRLRAELKARKGEILDFLRSAVAEFGRPSPPVPVARDQVLPLSFSQQRLWFITQLEPGNASYNLPAAVAVSGPLDAAVLIRSLAALVDRHETLRTAFADASGQPPPGELPICPPPGEPRQVIAPACRLAMPVVDLGRLPAAQRPAAAERLAEVAARRLFDLEQAPLVRTLLLRLAESDHLLVVTMHHIISDGWSMGVLIHE
ncbi:MAG: non-ribosomal peptide synthetase, partial [bacterium]|nr:non-ribosomal peptide synthetase [bacterium]